MKAYATKLRRTAPDAGAARGAEAAPRRSGESMLALLSLIVAVLATAASMAQSVFAYLGADAPYKALVYQEQVRRTVDAVDFMTGLRADVERWEAMQGAGAMDTATVLPEIGARMRQFAELSQRAWLLTPVSQRAIGAAARDFNAFASACLVVRYRGGDAPAGCGAAFRRHETSLNRATRAALRDVRFDYRRTGGSGAIG